MTRSDNLTGALLMMASMACFTFNDTVMKAMAGDVPLFQLLLLRGLITTVLVGCIAWRMGALSARLPRRDWGLMALRTAAEVGSLVASRAKEAGIDSVVFDRGGFKYHGRVKALADAAREGGLTL